MPRSLWPHPVLYRAVFLAEDRRSLLDVELEDVAGGKPEAESDGDDAAGGRAGDQIEVFADRVFEMFFEPRKKRGREHAADPAAVERQDAENLAVARQGILVSSVHAASPRS